MLRLHCGIRPHSSWEVWRRAVCVFRVSLSYWLCAAACLSMRVLCCVLVEDQGFEGMKKHIAQEGNSRSHAAFSAPPPRSHPTAQGNSCPAPLEKLPHAAVQRTLRHADRSALTRALEESAPATRGRRGGGGVCPELMLFLLCTRCRDTHWRIINLIIIRPTADDSRTLKRSEIFIKNVL